MNPHVADFSFIYMKERFSFEGFGLKSLRMMNDLCMSVNCSSEKALIES